MNLSIFKSQSHKAFVTCFILIISLDCFSLPVFCIFIKLRQYNQRQMDENRFARVDWKVCS